MPSYRPTALTFNSYGWKGTSQPYNASDIPVPDGMSSSGVDRTILEQQFAYEWFDSSSQYSTWRNPPFVTAAAGRLNPSLLQDGVPRILRGFIRRAEYDMSDKKSTARLYFMFNPENITRDYVSYLDQGALDPFNTVFQAGNLVPPPSFMDFSFSLMFDRQEESLDPTFPGVFVDYQFFDLVVRNVLPATDPNTSTTTELPDNGVMMVNPRDITAVFSPQITVQGRPLNAKVTFQKFTHRMVPTRMQIDLTMRVTYFGPMKDMVEYTPEVKTAADSIPWDITNPSPFTMTTADIQNYAQTFMEQMKNNLLTEDQLKDALDALPEGSVTRGQLITDANLPINESIVEFALKTAQTYGTKYTSSTSLRGDFRPDKQYAHADCSSFVWGSFRYHDPPYNKEMKGYWASDNSAPSTSMMINDMEQTSHVIEIFKATSTDKTKRQAIIEPALPKVVKGDLMLRKAGIVAGHVRHTDHGDEPVGHVAFVYSNDTTAKKIVLVHAGGPDGVPAGKSNPTPWSYFMSDYTHCYRPTVGTPSLDARNEEVPGN